MTRHHVWTLLLAIATLTALATPAAAAAPKIPLPDIEIVPPAEKGKQAPFCSTTTGPHQKALERYLKLTPDGKQSPADCAAIQRFQDTYDIWPDTGYAGPVTWMAAKLAYAQEHPNDKNRCHPAPRVICIDLTRQILWLQQDTKTVYGPIPIRTGTDAYATRAGTHKVYLRNVDHWSTIYDAPMPYAQFFDGGQAVHGSYGSLFSPSGSHGCVNLHYEEAKALWAKTKKGDTVHVFGRKPAE
ncbi:L,D-transpeptidase family protein [Streptomyces smaragdinus]|nr:L,D-transpeptidase family protein [Streptomyces smaragdinus]